MRRRSGTYIDGDAGQGEDLGLRRAGGQQRVAVELVPSAVPLDGVQPAAVQVIVAGQAGRLAALHGGGVDGQLHVAETVPV